MKSKQKRRFDIYNPRGFLGNSEEVGILPCDKDYELGTPSFDRNENVTLVASNSALKECLLVRLKWRPDKKRQVVTLMSKLTLTLTLDAERPPQVFEFSDLETYEPSESSLRPGRITQYGSKNLKLLVASPYRRMRLVFNGHLRSIDAAAADDDDKKTVFIKLSCVINPISAIFDFYDQPPVNLRHDRHEQRVRFNGEYLLLDANADAAGATNTSRVQSTFAMWGYYTRHFSGTDSGANKLAPAVISTKRLFAYMNNGQGFQIGTQVIVDDNEAGDTLKNGCSAQSSAGVVEASGDRRSELNFGYTAFDIRPQVQYIDKPYKLDAKLDESLNKFQLQISGQKCEFACTGERAQASSGARGWFKVEMNGKAGWAWLSLDDELSESELEVLAIENQKSERELAMKLGKICSLVKPSGSDDNDTKKQPLVVSIEDDCCRSSELVGAKASSLAQLLKFTRYSTGCEGASAPYEVPFAFVLTRYAHDLILAESAELRAAIEELQDASVRERLEGKEKSPQEKVNTTSGVREKLESLLRQTSLPKAITEELWSKLTVRYGAEKLNAETSSNLLFAVRSSSWGEDEDDMSAAGQLTTILNVKPSEGELSDAIMSCFASKFSAENVEYKRQHGQPLDMPMAVVIQEMISCDKAGVMFTCEPTSGDESLITITANYGLGESVVSAAADPDSIKVRVFAGHAPELKIEQVSIGEKKVVISGGGGDSQQDKSKCCLSDEEILRLARCALQVRRYFWDQRRDIEWGLLAERLYLFQARPVTGLETYTQEELLHECDRPNSSERSCYTRANIGEVMPYAIKPLTLTYSVFAWNIVGFGLVSRVVPEFQYAPQVSADVTQEKYHSFFSLRCSMFLSRGEAEKNALTKSMEISFFGREMGPQPEIVEASRGFINPPSPFTGFKYDLITLPIRLMPKRVVMRELPVMQRHRQNIQNLKLTGLTGNEEVVDATKKSDNTNNKKLLLGLYKQMQAAMWPMVNCWENHIHIIMIASNANVVLSAVLSQYIKDPMQLSAATNKFLAISPDVVSAEIPERIRDMAKLVSDKEHFSKLTSAEALEYLTKGADAQSDDREKLKRGYEQFMENFGHRCYNEFELADLAWREDPAQVVEMIQKNCCSATVEETIVEETTDSAAAAAAEQKEDKLKRPKTIDDVIKSLNVDMKLKDRLLVKHVLAPKCQLMLSMREKTKNILVMFTDILRENSRLIAKELVRQQRLPDCDLFYYVLYEEVKPLVEGYQPAIVMQASRRRQLFKRMFSETWRFDEVIWEVVPNHMKPTKELDDAIAQAPRLCGTPASSGKVRGRVCLVSGYKELDKVKPGTILLTHSTDIAFSPVFPLISGIITEVGGLISHGAVVAREYGLPSVIGIPDVTLILKDGEEIILDADNGTIIRLSKSGGDHQQENGGSSAEKTTA